VRALHSNTDTLKEYLAEEFNSQSIKAAGLVYSREEIEDNKKRLEENIEVARLIQNSLLPDEEKLRSYFDDAFILYLPKDVVSGDFYWFQLINDKIFVAMVDCVGHGVSGALMSMVGLQTLTQVVKEYRYLHASEILDRMNEHVINTFEQEGKQEFISYSMDMSLCIIDKSENLVDFAGAKNNLYLIHAENNEIEKYQGDKFSIGYKIDNKLKKYKSNRFYYNEGDTIYMYTDGLPDQLSDEKNNFNKFLHVRVRNMLQESCKLPMLKQKKLILQTLMDWRGNSEQLDDISIIGIRL
jgi:serine phosphatase RsbU (regulator of sigma subunit)